MYIYIYIIVCIYLYKYIKLYVILLYVLMHRVLMLEHIKEIMSFILGREDFRDES